MATVIEEASKLIRARLQELDIEERKLQRAVADLEGGSVAPSAARKKRRGRPSGSGRKTAPQPDSPATPTSSPAPKATRKRRRKGGKRVPKSEREQAILAFIKDKPDAKIKEIAAAAGTNANYANNLLTGLRKRKAITRKDGKLVVV